MISQIYEQNQASRLICCGVSGGIYADGWEIGLIGGTNRNCNSVFGGDADRQLEFDANSCLSLECDDHDWSQSACEALSFCYWEDRAGLNNCHFR